MRQQKNSFIKQGKRHARRVTTLHQAESAQNWAKLSHCFVLPSSKLKGNNLMRYVYSFPLDIDTGKAIPSVAKAKKGQ